MNQRERFLNTARFKTVDRAFLLAPWAWGATVNRWHKEGMPENINLTEYFGTDQEICLPIAMQGRYGPHLHPPLTRRIIEKNESYVILQDEEGNIVKLFGDDPLQSMPQWIEYPMKDRNDWENIIKPRLDAKIPGRYPQDEDWEKYVNQVKDRDYALGIWTGSFYGWPRGFMGVELLSTMFYDDPMLVHEICEHIADFVIEMITPILKQIKLDFAFIWEDMGAKSGPLCSPKTYSEFMLPPLKRVTDILHQYGVDIIIIDSDGNNDPLIPLWIDGGVTGLRPFEIASDSDPVQIRKKYGNLIIQGGIDKRALSKGKADIEREVLSKVPWLCLQGGYFPQVDHLVPPDVSLDNYKYYSQLVKSVVDDPERYLYEARRMRLEI
ncbi:MAG: uroporphyrinogen decarboxylase family protein [Candidatus Poribacteria bacterium]